MPPLFTIKTDRFHLTWSGPRSDDVGVSSGMLRVGALSADAAPRVEVLGEKASLEAGLGLTEQTPYRLFMRTLTSEPVTLRHNDPLATHRLVEDEGGSILSGIVDFGGQVGKSRFAVVIGGREEVTFEVEVFPTKASLEDVEAMRDEVEETLAGLALEYLRSTTLSTRPFARTPRRATWLTLLRRALPELEEALEQVAARPHRELNPRSHLVRSERVQRPDATLRRAVLRGRGGGAWERAESGLQLRRYVPARLVAPSLDTSEHRWLRFRLGRMRATLAALEREEAGLPQSARRRRTRADLTEAEHRLRRLTRLAPLAAAIGAGAPTLPTQRLMTAPGYAEAYRACLEIELGVDMASGPVPHATRDLHLLYEMWCYLTVVRRVASVIHQRVPEHAFFQAEHKGVRLMLRRGQRHKVSFEDGRRRIEIAYNPRFDSRPGLLAQRPDILLTIESGGASRRYILDAKYRRDDASGYQRRYGAPGPPEDALGDLHRYRDAIVEADGDAVRRSVVAAVALFPYREPEPDAFESSRLWTSIEAVGVGAIPLVPGATDYLDRWLEGVIG